MAKRQPQTDPSKFFSLLRWLDGKPLAIEPYRAKIFSDVLTDVNGRLPYSLALFLRGKKNNKSLDLILAALFFLLCRKSIGGMTCLAVAFDEDQANQDLDLAKKLIAVNPVLQGALTIKSKSIERRDGDGILEIRPGRDFSGQHGGKYDYLGIDELHSQRDYRLLEALAPDPTRESLMWVCSYNTLYWRSGTPLYDMIQRGWSGKDKKMYFSAYTSSKTTDPDFFEAEPERRANPSMDSWNDSGAYLEQQRLRLPSFMFRRLHLCEGGLPEGSAFSVEKIDGAIDRGVRVRPPETGIEYIGFVDMSGGSNDDSCLGISHRDVDGRAILDLVMSQGVSCPFDPIFAVERFVATLKEYRCSIVTGDRYAGETFRAAFEKLGIGYHVSELTRHEIYSAIEPKLNSGQIVLLDCETMESQFLSLIFRNSKIDHPAGPAEHDDFSNAACGALNLAAQTFATEIGSTTSAEKQNFHRDLETIFNAGGSL